MEKSLESLSGLPPSLLLVGMRGAGKTTLGQLAAEHLQVPFLDADELFSHRHSPHNAKTFVAEHGWPAFRREETKVLIEILTQIQQEGKPMVVSLGGGIVEEEENRTLLKASWSDDFSGLFARSKRVAVVHVFREVDNVLLDVRGLPSWGVANGREVWERRRPWFRESSSHEFVNFTESTYQQSTVAESSQAARLRFEAVERDFVAFILRLLSVYEASPISFQPSRKGRSYLATFPFSDLHPHVKKLPLLTLGVDAVELRADLLRDPTIRTGEIVEAYENPSLSYLSEQVALIRRHLSGYPLVFTLRTPAQGGRYPYPADAPAEALFKSLHHALKLGSDMIDIEMELDPSLTKRLVQDAKERNISVLISWRDKRPPHEGGFSWSSERAGALYEGARALGADVVKIVGTAGKVSDNFALRVFAAGIEGTDGDQEDGESDVDRPGLSAYNMGYKGRISRFLNPTLASVTHDLAKQLTGRGIIGNPSMTFSEIQRALHLSGLLEKAAFLHLCDGQQIISMERDWQSIMYRDWFDTMGLPFSMEPHAVTTSKISLREIIDQHDGLNGDLRGVLVDGVEVVDQVKGDINVEATGYCDTVIIDEDGGLFGYNKLVEGLSQLIQSSISPSVHLNKHSAAVVLTTRQASAFARSAQRAIHNLGLQTVSVLNPVSPGAAKFLAAPPTVIIDLCEEHSNISLPLYDVLLSGKDGGLYVDLFANTEAQNLMREERYSLSGWRYLGSEAVYRQTHSLRFWHFTGRRAPVR